MEANGKRYQTLATIQAVVAAVVVSGLALLYKVRPDYARSSSATFACLMLAMLVVVYYLSFHQILKRHLERTSSIIMSLITASTIWLVIYQTGGLDSPYIVLWLLFVVALGLVDAWLPVAAAIITIGIYGAWFATTNPSSNQALAKAGQLALTLVAVGVAEWIRRRGGTKSPATSQLTGKLNEEQLKTQALMASMGEGVIVVNAARQVQLFNRAAQLLTGWDDKSAFNLDYRTVLKLKNSQDQAIADNIDPFSQAWSKQAAVVSSDMIVTTQAGRKLPITMTASPIYDASGQVTGGIALFRDISAEKEMERTRGEFISTASHEMRTPIAAIEGYLALAMNPTTATIDDRAKGYLEKAHDSIGHLGELFKNLLVITKIEDKKLADKVSVVDLSQLTMKAVEDMKTLATKKGLTLQLTSGDQLVAEAKPLLPVYKVKANPERLREVVMNLIENAIKYTPAGRVTVNIGGDNENVTIGVKDTGLGIASEDIPHLFQKFYRVDSSATRTIGGTGLGLYICRTVIELYGGRVWAESQVGQGSTFSFSLPRLQNEAAASAVVVPGSGQVVMPAGGIITTQPTQNAPTVPVDAVAPPAMPVPATSTTPAPAPSPGSIAQPNPNLVS